MYSSNLNDAVMELEMQLFMLGDLDKAQTRYVKKKIETLDEREIRQAAREFKNLRKIIVKTSRVKPER